MSRLQVEPSDLGPRFVRETDLATSSPAEVLSAIAQVLRFAQNDNSGRTTSPFFLRTSGTDNRLPTCCNLRAEVRACVRGQASVPNLSYTGTAGEAGNSAAFPGFQ